MNYYGHRYRDRRRGWTVSGHAALGDCCGVPRIRGGPRGGKPLRSIAQKATAARKDARYSSALALSEDVGRYLDGLPVLAQPESILDRGRRVLGHNKTLVSLILAYLVMRILLFLFART